MPWQLKEYASQIAKVSALFELHEQRNDMASDVRTHLASQGGDTIAMVMEDHRQRFIPAGPACGDRAVKELAIFAAPACAGPQSNIKRTDFRD